MSTLFNDQEIFDLGTHHGSSAYALAYNPSNIVHSFDITDQVTNPVIKNHPNLRFHLCDLFTEETRQPWLSKLLASPLIMMDVDPHNGIMEIGFYQMLVKHQYRGLLVCDDIWYFKEMRDIFWSQIPNSKKVDLTFSGHWSGTGVILGGCAPHSPLGGKHPKGGYGGLAPQRRMTGHWSLPILT